MFYLGAIAKTFGGFVLSTKITFQSHYILYPNPWPKAVHLIRRWYGHPVFPYLKLLAKETYIRSNWQTYLEEFQIAWQLLTNRTGDLEELSVTTPLTLFEKKYQFSQQKLYQLNLNVE